MFSFILFKECLFALEILSVVMILLSLLLFSVNEVPCVKELYLRAGVGFKGGENENVLVILLGR